MSRMLILISILNILIIMNCYSSESDLPTDTILLRVMSSAEKYNDLVEHYSAEVYTRSYIETVKKNIFYKYTHLIPQFVLHDPHSDEALIETISKFRFEFPNNYIHDIQKVIGTLTRQKDIDLIPFKLLNINIYGETTNDESLFMPIRFSTAKYYRYELYQTFTENNKTYYNIHFLHLLLKKISFI